VRIRLIIIAVIGLLAVTTAWGFASRQPRNVPGPVLRPSGDGWGWITPPMDWQPASTINAEGFQVSLRTTPAGVIAGTAVQVEPAGWDIVELRAVFFDERGDTSAVAPFGYLAPPFPIENARRADVIAYPTTTPTHWALQARTADDIAREFDSNRLAALDRGVALLPRPLMMHPWPLRGPTALGTVVDLARLRGQPVIVHGWRSTNWHTQNEIALLRDASREFPQLRLVAVNLDGDVSQACRAAMDLRIEWPSIVVAACDPARAVTSAMPINQCAPRGPSAVSPPIGDSEAVLIDAHGVVRAIATPSAVIETFRRLTTDAAALGVSSPPAQH
jgi:hypothetical protein